MVGLATEQAADAGGNAERQRTLRQIILDLDATRASRPLEMALQEQWAMRTRDSGADPLRGAVFAETGPRWGSGAGVKQVPSIWPCASGPVIAPRPHRAGQPGWY